MIELMIFLIFFFMIYFYKRSITLEYFEEPNFVNATQWLRTKLLQDKKITITKISKSNKSIQYKKTDYGKQIDKITWFYTVFISKNSYEYIAIVDQSKTNKFTLIDFRIKDNIKNYKTKQLYKYKYNKKYKYTTGLYPFNYSNKYVFTI